MACSVGVDFSAKLLASLAKNFEVRYKNSIGHFIYLLPTLLNFLLKMLVQSSICFQDEYHKQDNLSLRNLTLLFSYLYIFGVCSRCVAHDLFGTWLCKIFVVRDKNYKWLFCSFVQICLKFQVELAVLSRSIFWHWEIFVGFYSSIIDCILQQILGAKILNLDIITTLHFVSP